MKTLGLTLFLLSSVLAILFLESSLGRASRYDATKQAGGPEFVTLSGIQDQSSKQPYAPLDFESRCHGTGILVCEGFDSQSEFVEAKWPGSGLYPAEDGVLHGTLDTTVKASGNGSLRFEIPALSPANAAGSWRQSFGQNFGEGATFYVQFRQRFSREMLKNDWGGTSWKQVLFHNASATCGQVELATGQYYHEGFPIMYTDCGSHGLYTNHGKPPMKLEQGDFNCWYSRFNANDCFHYPADEWITFYYQVSIGHWGIPDSTINAWVALPGKPYKQWINMPNFTLENDHPGKDYDTLTLLPYMSHKDAKLRQPTAYTWYDEVIVSTQPIAPAK